MATTLRVSRSIPSSQRSTLITDVAAGDQVDVEEILGRPARGIKFVTGDSADSISYRLNNKLKLYQRDKFDKTDIQEIWSAGESFPVFTSTGNTEHETQEGVSISSFEVTALTLATGTTIEVVAW